MGEGREICFFLFFFGRKKDVSFFTAWVDDYLMDFCSFISFFWAFSL